VYTTKKWCILEKLDSYTLGQCDRKTIRRIADGSIGAA